MHAVVEYMTSIPDSQTVLMEPSTADKKRNKLGYHRTSVACVHCRRRKIRCLVATDDPQGRCENCIRLRKECQFFPVDQQPPIEKKPRPSSRLETVSTDPSIASSSPPTFTSEQTEAYYPYQPITLSSGQEVAAFNAGTYPGNPIAQFAPDATAPIDPSVPWDEFTTISDPQLLATMSAASKSTMINMPPGVWNQTPTPMAAMSATGPLPGAPIVPSQPQTLTPTSPYTVQPDGSIWQVAPARSMTFPAQPNITTSYATSTAFPQSMTTTDLKRRMTSPAQVFPGGPVNPQSPPTADLQGAPISVSYPGQPPAAAMGYPGWQDVNAMAPMNMVQYPIYTGDATQQAAYGSPPMGHPGQGP